MSPKSRIRNLVASSMAGITVAALLGCVQTTGTHFRREAEEQSEVTGGRNGYDTEVVPVSSDTDRATQSPVEAHQSIDKRGREPAIIVARWNGGELTREKFFKIYDPSGQSAVADGEPLMREVCKAVYQEIYGSRGEKEGLDRLPEVRQILDDWTRDQLAGLYLKRFGPQETLDLSDHDLRQFYEQHIEDYAIQTTVDIQVLFVGRETVSTGADSCQLRMARAMKRLAEGEDFLDLAIKERKRSGDANGEFNGVFLSQLAPELVEAISNLSQGEISDTIESPRGLFRLRVVRWGKKGFVPLERVEASVRRGLQDEKSKAWMAKALPRLREELNGLPEAATDDAVLAAAAIEAELDRDPDFIKRRARHRAWTLADAAFRRDYEILPSDREIGVDITARGEAALSDQSFDLVVFLVSGSNLSDAEDSAADVVVQLPPVSEVSGDFDEHMFGHTLVRRLDLREVQGVDVEDWSHEVGMALEEGASGKWLGPFKVEINPEEPPKIFEGAAHELDGIGGGPTVALVGVRSVSVLISEDQRRRAYRRFRNQITTTDSFADAFAKRWGLVLSPEGSDESMASNQTHR